MLQLEKLSQSFLRFAEREGKGSSPLYESLSIHIARDKELLQLASFVQEGQPVPNLLFGTVHFLLLKGKEHPLKEFYPSIVNEERACNEAFPAFKDFCSIYQNQIKELLQTRRVQTNEVRRCAYLYPVFCLIYEKVKQPLAIIEIGTSAGLQLLWDQFSYSYVIRKNTVKKIPDFIFR